jgi:hypothetical protein
MDGDVVAEALAAQMWKCAKCGKARVPYFWKRYAMGFSVATVSETIVDHSKNRLCYRQVKVNVSDVIYRKWDAIRFTYTGRTEDRGGSGR